MERVLTDNSWAELREILIFGYGRQGKKCFEMLADDFEVLCIIESDREKIGKKVCSSPILKLEEALQLFPNKKIIVTTSQRYYREISTELQNKGLIENYDFVMYQTFIVEWYFEYKNQLRVPKIDLPVTSFCSLNCEKCHVFIPYWKRHMHYSFQELSESIDDLFKNVDYVVDMDLVGGEPLIHPEIDKILEYIGSKYNSRIGYLGLITNGTVVLNASTLSVIKKYDIHISISDYSDEVGYKDKIEQLIELLKRENVPYMKNSNIEWYDFCFPNEKRELAHEDAVKHYHACNTIFHTVNKSKLYGCGTAWAASMSGLYQDRAESIDLRKSSESTRMQIAKLMLNQNDEGCFSFCSHCGGFGEDNSSIVPTARQIRNI